MSAVRSYKNANKEPHSYVHYKNNILKYLNTSKRLQKCLKKAFHDRNWPMAKLLLNKGAYIDYRYESRGYTLLFLCTTQEDIKELVQMGANVNAKNKFGQSVLGHAIRNCWDVELISLLLNYGANTNAQGTFGLSPLGLAVVHQSKNLPLIKLMMEYKADINGSDKYNPHKPLTDAMIHRPCARILIKYGVLHGSADHCKRIIKQLDRKMIDYPEIDQYLEKCIEEVAEMKQIFVQGKRTLYEFLNQPKHERLQMDTIETSKFVIYQDMIEETVKRVACRNNLLKDIYKFRISAQEVVTLDHDSIFEIVKYLNNDDLRCFIKAFC